MSDVRNVSPEILAAIESAEGSVDVRDLTAGYELEIETRNTVYRITADAEIYTPDRSRSAGDFHGSNFGGSMYKPYCAWVGGHAEFYAPSAGTKKITTAICRVDVVKA